VDLFCGAGCPRHTSGNKGAVDAVQIALARGWSGADVLAATTGWLAYTASPQGHTIVHPGFFTTSRLRRREPAPEVRDAPHTRGAPRSETNTAPFGEWQTYVEQRMAEIVQR
jgi:hypothetical protein